MAKKVSVGIKYEINEYGYRRATTRDWTEDEVAEAVAFLKQDMPEGWAELEELERTTGDLRESDAAGNLFAALSDLYPDCEPSEISQLSLKVRIARRSALGIEF
ncbi:hypothetical protein [Pararhizobium qamdonense]|uniref:hypothetical protein n=1 Tax=Pararhizobium qamdonense TaxID=3031126 RepID=UPI0023E18D7F|nr:hypothetical protein [Pararhizobium qamdonense]